LTTLAVALLLCLHATLAVRSLIQENPTIDEVIHLPAGLTYWQKGTFRLYRHNPPLVKLVAALPLLGDHLVLDYTKDSWRSDPPNKAAFAHEFMENNASDYFELFTRARLWMPLFSIIGGLVVFSWSRALYGTLGGLLSLSLWVFGPNILAHTRLVTTDMGATSLGALATFVFWLYLKKPSWSRACLAGVCLGLGELSKFSLLLLYGVWPILLVLKLLLERPCLRLAIRSGAQFLVMVILSILIIDIGYGFEGVGTSLGSYEFTCRTLTVPVPPGMARPRNADKLLDGAWRFRVNRFRETPFAMLPVPLPRHYVLGFDDQKLEAEGIPRKFLDPKATGPDGDEIDSYPVYLDGTLAQKSWWYYYLLTLVYKVPEGTSLLVLGSLVALGFSRRSRSSGFDELAVLLVPALVLFAMSTLTNINLGLRYVLPIFPYVFISTGKLAPWALGFEQRKVRRLAVAAILVPLCLTVVATLSIHPHYLAYFNLASGGPGQGSRHLIDSNIDWGQDLVTLRRWLSKNAPGERVGLAYFGQINPRIFEARGEGFDWFLPPPLPGTMPTNDIPARYKFRSEPIRLEPGLYAVSASLVRGLPWRVYDSPGQLWEQKRWAPYAAWKYAFSYFDQLKPVAQVGHSIFIYRVTEDDARRLSSMWEEPKGTS
jgi:hypothetical protein